MPIHLAVSEVVVEGQRTFTGIMRDISLERADKEEIRRQNERLSVTVRNAPMGIVTYRFGETFASTNRAFEIDDRLLRTSNCNDGPRLADHARRSRRAASG